MSFGVPRALLRFSPLSIIPPMLLHASLQYMVLLPKAITARNFGTFHKPLLCGKSVAWYIKHFQLVGSQSCGSCMRDTFCTSEKEKSRRLWHSWLERAHTVVCLSQAMYVAFLPLMIYTSVCCMLRHVLDCDDFVVCCVRHWHCLLWRLVFLFHL
jgi:hypothetical protein